MKVLGVVLDVWETCHSHIAKSSDYHDQTIRHIRHLLTPELALACSLILSRINYCNALLHCAPASTIQKLQRVTMQLGSCSKRWDELTPSCCCAAYTGCRWSRGSSTRWQWLHLRSCAPQHPATTAITQLREEQSSDAPLFCFSVVFIIQHLPFGTHFLGQYWKVSR